MIPFLCFVAGAAVALCALAVTGSDPRRLIGRAVRVLASPFHSAFLRIRYHVAVRTGRWPSWRWPRVLAALALSMFALPARAQTAPASGSPVVLGTPQMAGPITLTATGQTMLPAAAVTPPPAPAAAASSDAPALITQILTHLGSGTITKWDKGRVALQYGLAAAMAAVQGERLSNGALGTTSAKTFGLGEHLELAFCPSSAASDGKYQCHFGIAVYLGMGNADAAAPHASTLSGIIGAQFGWGTTTPLYAGIGWPAIVGNGAHFERSPMLLVSVPLLGPAEAIAQVLSGL